MKRKRVTTSRPLDFEIWYFPVNFLVEKCLSVSFKLVKVSFTTVGPLLEKMRLPTTWQNPLLPSLEKSFRRPCSFVCRWGLLKFFAHVHISIKCIISRHLIYAGVITNCTNKKMFFNFQLTKSFWRRSRKFLDVEARSRAKTLDVWSWSQSPSLKFEFRIRYCSLQYGNCIC